MGITIRQIFHLLMALVSRFIAMIRWWNAARILGGVLLSLGITSAVRGFELLHPGSFDLIVFVTEFYANASTELVSIAITILIIDGLNERRSAMERRRELILQMGSQANDFAMEASRIMSQNRTLYDGTMKGANLAKANLRGADLHLANLEEVDLFKANLANANLHGANLQAADLTMAYLQGADLQEANLRGTKLSQTQFDENTILPSGINWDLDMDMQRFTDQNHPEFYDVKARYS